MDFIDFQGEKRPATYLGDGVYAIFDGYGIWLHANDHEHPTDRIYLEPQVLSQLVTFDKDVRDEQMIKRCIELNKKGGK